MSERIKVGDMPYEVVARVFESPTEKPRGEHFRKKTPLYETGEPAFVMGIPLLNHINTDGHHVRTSFSTEKRPYIGECIKILNKITQGSTESGDLQLSLSDRIIDVTLADGGTASYFDTMQNSLLVLIEEFAESHSNLIPAFADMMNLAGAEGMSIACQMSSLKLLAHHFGRHPDPFSNKTFRDVMLMIAPRNLTDDHFIGVHPPIPHPAAGDTSYEVHCMGIDFADSLMHQFDLAASRLALSSAVMQSYLQSEGHVRDTAIYVSDSRWLGTEADIRLYVSDVQKRVKRGIYRSDAVAEEIPTLTLRMPPK